MTIVNTKNNTYNVNLKNKGTLIIKAKSRIKGLFDFMLDEPEIKKLIEKNILVVHKDKKELKKKKPIEKKVFKSVIKSEDKEDRDDKIK